GTPASNRGETLSEQDRGIRGWIPDADFRVAIDRRDATLSALQYDPAIGKNPRLIGGKSGGADLYRRVPLYNRHPYRIDFINVSNLGAQINPLVIGRLITDESPRNRYLRNFL